MTKLIHLIALSSLTVIGAHANLITITFNNPSQTGVPGQTLSFFGTITNTDTNTSDAPIFLNSDSFNFTLTDATVNDNFLSAVPISLAPGASSGIVDLFDVTIANPEGLSFGAYSGIYGLTGGMDGGDGSGSDNLAQVNFSVTTTPEPKEFALVGIGVALMYFLRRGCSRKLRA